MITDIAKPPVVCPHCFGSCIEPDEECAEIPCLACGGDGYAVSRFDLGPTRTHPKGRPVEFMPGSGVLKITRGPKTETYTVHEFIPDPLPNDGGARAFEFVKVGTLERHHVLYSPERRGCDCRGKTAEVTQKYNARAARMGRAVYDSAGCVHLDFVMQAFSVGLLDKPRGRSC